MSGKRSHMADDHGGMITGLDVQRALGRRRTSWLLAVLGWIADVGLTVFLWAVMALCLMGMAWALAVLAWG